MLLFNRYEYNPQSDFIGKGGFSKVYKAYDKKFQRWVALKIYKTNDLAERYSPMAEIQRVIDLDHPNICRYIDFDEVEKEDSFGEKEIVQVGVMELLNGGNFLKYYTDKKDLIIFKKLLTDVLHGLGYLHKKGIIHRDIKPANILIKETESGPVAKITDFGISKKSDSSNSATSSALIVSIPYMAPEQLNVQKYGIDEKVSFNIDFWSLGVAVYEIITGDLLFKNNDQETAEQIMLNILSPDVPKKIKQLPEPYQKFVETCLQKDAKQRIQKAEDLLNILAEYIPDVGITQTIKMPGVDPEIVPEEEHFDGDETRLIPRPAIFQTESVPVIPESDDDPDATRILSKAPESKKEDGPANEDADDSGDETRILPRQTNETPVVPEKVSEDDTRLFDVNDRTETLKKTQANSLSKQKDGSVTLFSRYEYMPVSDLIGKGGFSRVYRAFDTKLSRWVALKIYKVDQFTDKYSPIAEIKRVISFDHSNICRYLDIEEIEKKNLFGETETVQVCVMELLDGGNFYEYYSRNNNLEVFRKLLGDVFSGLSYLHKNGIIHRDIKPANILIKETLEGPVAKITDFGISKKSDSVNSESSSSLIVSIPYMAPEQLNVKKYGLDEKIRYNLDLWSLGVTIYEVLTGKLLFKNSENESSEQIMANIMAPEIPEKIQELPSPFREIVTLCVVKNARDRVQKVEELTGLLHKIAVRSPSPEPVIPVESRNPEPAKPVEKIIPEPTTPEERKMPEPAKPPSRISLSVSEDEELPLQRTRKKPAPPVEIKKRGKITFSLPLLVLIVVAIAGPGMYFYFRSKRVEPTVLPYKPVISQPVVKTKTDSPAIRTDTTVGKIQPPTAEPVSPPVTEVKTPPVESEKAKPARIPVTTVRSLNPGADPATSAVHKAAVPRVTKNLSQELLLKFTPMEPCTITIKNLTAGYTLDTEELLPKKTLNVYLKPGKYSIVATSNSDPSKVRNYPFDVKPEDVNQILTYTIRF
jgi:serine/threonine protein kinase